MGSWDSRDYHKHHLSVVLVTNTYCPFLSNCCGDSLHRNEEKFTRNEKKKCFSISMRLTQLLMIWPKKRPNGNIWKGKNSMVRTVQPWNLNALDKDIAREKKNIHICLNPVLTPEEERRSIAARQGALRVDQVLFRMRKARIEQTAMAPTHAEDNLKHLTHNVRWEE